jgi:hypothetical protein
MHQKVFPMNSVGYEYQTIHRSIICLDALIPQEVLENRGRLGITSCYDC